MTILNVQNPFGAPVYYEQTVESTMAVSRELAKKGEPHGTVITAGYQKSGRGRIKDRIWQMESEKGLPLTILLRYKGIESIPAALTLRTGLAVSLAVEDFVPILKGKVMVKWPNDIIIGTKKIAGILCEAEDGIVHAGIGINFAQKGFPGTLAQKATSIALCSGKEFTREQRLFLLEKILEQLYIELETKTPNWKSRLEQRLYKKDEQVIFIDGVADSAGNANSGKEIHGLLSGITPTGELLITPSGDTQPQLFITGELKV